MTWLKHSMKVQQKLIAKKKLKDNYPISNDLVIVQLLFVQSRADHFCDTELVASSLDVFRNQKYTPIQLLAVGTGSSSMLRVQVTVLNPTMR
jgi:hypothetical protein